MPPSPKHIISPEKVDDTDLDDILRKIRLLIDALLVKREEEPGVTELPLATTYTDYAQWATENGLVSIPENEIGAQWEHIKKRLEYLKEQGIRKDCHVHWRQSQRPGYKTVTAFTPEAKLILNSQNDDPKDPFEFRKKRDYKKNAASSPQEIQLKKAKPSGEKRGEKKEINWADITPNFEGYQKWLTLMELSSDWSETEFNARESLGTNAEVFAHILGQKMKKGDKVKSIGKHSGVRRIAEISADLKIRLIGSRAFSNPLVWERID